VADDASNEAPLTPEDVAERSFPNAFRGFDPVEVRAFLGRVADEMRALSEREAQLRQTVEELSGRADTSSAERDVATAKDEADRLVREAMERVGQLSAAATAEADRVLSEARAEVAAIARTKNEEAESVAVRKIADAEREAAAIRVKAREDAESIVDAAKERGREMIAEAQSARERMIADINKRKRAAAAQLDQLRAGRDRLLETLRVVRRNLDEITTRLEVVEGGGRAPEASVPSGGGGGGGGGGDAPPSTGPAVRPVRTSRVALGELPPQGRPSIDAPQARTVARVEREDVAAAATTAAAAAAEPAAEAPSSTEERRSSALRILRRHRPGQARPSLEVPPPGRETTGEGVRIIRPEASPEPEPEPEPEPIAEVVEEAAEPAAVEDTDAATDASPEPELEPEPEPEDDDEPLPPLRQEELRPRIEDLFARIRAERDPNGTASPVEPPPASRPEAASDNGDDHDEDEHHLQQRDAVIEPLVGQLARRLKRAVQDEQNASLDRLRTSRGRGGVDAVLAAPDAQPAPYRYAALPFLEEAARAATSAAPFGAVGVGVDDLAGALADDVASAIRARVERVVVDAAREDLDLAGVSERISAVYREWRTQRIEQLATHHLVAAWSRGTFVATPEGTPMRWIVDDDGPCPDCDDNALAGFVPRGQPFPTGQLHPPAHPGCRCTIVTAPVAAPSRQ
jgi:DivIVA domain-containing protein